MANKKGAIRQGASITIRLDRNHKVELQNYAELYDKPMSDLVRESISLWLNVQSPKGKTIESMVSQSG